MEIAMNIKQLADRWYEPFSKYAEDLYPGRYTRAFCGELAEQALLIKALAAQKHSTLVAHNYLYPEFHELADMAGDSLGLSFFVRDAKASRVDFGGVFFMAETAKIIVGEETHVFVEDYPEVLGCSLVFGTDHEWILRWKELNPDGILVTYINSDAYTKSMSDFISTSRNTDKIIAHALKNFPGRKILVLPDKFLAVVMKQRALALLRDEGIEADPDLVEIYTHKKGEWNACCYVHEQIDKNAAERSLADDPDAELMVHPECGCSAECLLKVDSGIFPRERAYILSTEGMAKRAKVSPAKRFIVATEKGMIYRLRKELPEKEFVPVSQDAVCRYMKANTLDKLLVSLQGDRIEVALCDDCCDPFHSYRDDRTIHVQRSIAEKAKIGILRMLQIQ